MKVVRMFATAVAVATPLSIASAADIPVEGAIYEPRPVAVIFRWTGVYLGLHAGGGSGFIQENSQPFPVLPVALGPLAAPGIGTGTLAPLLTRVDTSGAIAGGQVGLNYQTNWLVIGIEGQASWANFHGSTACVVTASPPVTVTGANCTNKIDALGTVAARLGVAFDHLLLYGKGGAAWANNGHQIQISLAPGTIVFSTNELRWGWMFGLGAEYAFTSNWSAKIEYDYMDMGTHAQRFTDSIGGNILIDTDIRERLNIVKVGVNYRFGVNPILVK